MLLGVDWLRSIPFIHCATTICSDSFLAETSASTRFGDKVDPPPHESDTSKYNKRRILIPSISGQTSCKLILLVSILHVTCR